MTNYKQINNKSNVLLLTDIPNIYIQYILLYNIYNYIWLINFALTFSTHPYYIMYVVRIQPNIPWATGVKFALSELLSLRYTVKVRVGSAFNACKCKKEYLNKNCPHKYILERLNYGNKWNIFLPHYLWLFLYPSPLIPLPFNHNIIILIPLNNISSLIGNIEI